MHEAGNFAGFCCIKTKGKHMKKTGIIGAMDAEIAGLLVAFDEKAAECKLHGSTFYSGKINGHEVVVVRCGIGKVNASFVTALLALEFGAGEILMTGIAGGIKGKTLDAVVPEGFVQHDVVMPGVPDGHLDIVDAVVLYADKGLRASLADEKSLGGYIATGEAFVSDSKAGAGIAQKFPEVTAVDMECGAAAQVCARLGIPFAAVKIISDGCDDGEYYDFLLQAANKAVSMVLKRFT